MSIGGPLTIGVVGTGGWATGFWSPAQHAPEVKLIACWDRAPEHASRFAETYHCEVAPTFEALLADSRIEAIAVFTPNSQHRVPTEAAAAAGKHVFTEKPIANLVEDGAAMVRACGQAGVTLMVGHSARYHGAMRALRSLLDDGGLGQLAMAEANISHSGGTRVTPDEWRWHRQEAPGGPLMQLSVHAFDTLHYLFGPTRRVTALASGALMSSEIEDVFLALLEHDSGLLSYVGTNYVSPSANYLRVYGVGGNAYVEGGQVTFIRAVEAWSSKREEVAVPEINAPAAEMAEFARAVRTGTPPETGGKEGLLALGVARACITSAEQGRAVLVQEALGVAAGLVR